MFSKGLHLFGQQWDVLGMLPEDVRQAANQAKSRLDVFKKVGIRPARPAPFGHAQGNCLFAQTLEEWTAFLDDVRVPLDNNQSERELCGIVVQRKNKSGSRSQRCTKIAMQLLDALFSLRHYPCNGKSGSRAQAEAKAVRFAFGAIGTSLTTASRGNFWHTISHAQEIAIVASAGDSQPEDRSTAIAHKGWRSMRQTKPLT